MINTFRNELAALLDRRIRSAKRAAKSAIDQAQERPWVRREVESPVKPRVFRMTREELQQMMEETPSITNDRNIFRWETYFALKGIWDRRQDTTVEGYGGRPRNSNTEALQNNVRSAQDAVLEVDRLGEERSQDGIEVFYGYEIVHYSAPKSFEGERTPFGFEIRMPEETSRYRLLPFLIEVME